MIATIKLIDTILNIFSILLLISVFASWFIQFNIINPHQPFVRTVLTAINAVVEPVLRPIRRLLPYMGGVDLSPLVALLLVYFLRNLLIYDIAPLLIG